MNGKFVTTLALVFACTGASAGDLPGQPHVAASDPVAAGRYLVRIGSCNDCHTPGWAASGGNIPEADRLTGNPVGYRGPWGTSYAANLRLTAHNLSEAAFVEMLHTRKGLPPMPWPNVSHLSAQDARAIYRYLRSLGAKGGPTPKDVPPGQEPTTPYEDMRLQQPLSAAGGGR